MTTKTFETATDEQLEMGILAGLGKQMTTEQYRRGAALAHKHWLVIKARRDAEMRASRPWAYAKSA